MGAQVKLNGHPYRLSCIQIRFKYSFSISKMTKVRHRFAPPHWEEMVKKKRRGAAALQRRRCRQEISRVRALDCEAPASLFMEHRFVTFDSIFFPKKSSERNEKLLHCHFSGDFSPLVKACRLKFTCMGIKKNNFKSASMPLRNFNRVP